ncbi:hypothetical protein SAMN04487936_10147 [Halobacillus dabanensis]|uniref:Uncharacterized protein n=1 Tax=Halobacillus dabanensis TaxID=240302 RepID=A0A1I3NSB0_HALDA|nr:hypothetical protein [Halobacillus dabanensis]SFJ11626.1 hypothetical protein SAMN04487936_10147 [Halobacillus dabanensis]
MKRRILFGLIAGAALVWTSVLITFLALPTEGDFPVEHHALSIGETVGEKQMTSQMASAFLDKQPAPIGEPPTILGGVKITKTWEEDVKEDGKLSIDTILETLELPSKVDNG